MPYIRRATSNKYATKDLPDCAGPKLNPFYARNYKIEWFERLDNGDDDVSSSDSGGDGFVYKVRIESKMYALKVFKFYNPEYEKGFWAPVLGDQFPPDKIALHRDPFFAECRAYGQLEDAQKESKSAAQIAIPCFGYLFLSLKDKKWLYEEEGIDLAEDCLDGLSPRNKISKRPVRAIVKELASDDSGVNQSSLGQILRNIQEMNKLGIYNQDIRKNNFRDGKLIDFGSSWTQPHYILDILEKPAAARWKNGDLAMFDMMVEEEGFKTNVRALPDERSRDAKRARPRK